MLTTETWQEAESLQLFFCTAATEGVGRKSGADRRTRIDNAIKFLEGRRLTLLGPRCGRGVGTNGRGDRAPIGPVSAGGALHDVVVARNRIPSEGNGGVGERGRDRCERVGERAFDNGEGVADDAAGLEEGGI